MEGDFWKGRRNSLTVGKLSRNLEDTFNILPFTSQKYFNATFLSNILLFSLSYGFRNDYNKHTYFSTA